MVRQGQEAAIKTSLFADEDGINHSLQIIVDHPFRHAAKERKGLIMRIQHHLMRLARVGSYKHWSAITQAEVRHFHRLFDTADIDNFLTPIKLTGFAGWKQQRNEGLLD